MSRMHSFFWGITLVLLIFVLLLVYAYMPHEVGLGATATGELTERVSKSQFFYGSLFFVFLTNVSFYLFGKLLCNSPVRQKKPEFVDALCGWTLVFNGLVNLIMVISLVVIAGLNVTDTPLFSRLSITAYAIPVLFLVGLGWLLVTLRKR